MWTSFDKAIFVIWILTFCSCCGLNNQGTRPRTFDQGFSKDHLQSWDDWLAKRSLGSYPWGISDLSRNKFQSWQDWIFKRRFGSPSANSDFNGVDKSKFQKWVDWVSKRSLGSGHPFPSFSDLDKSKFQQWSELVSKRMPDGNVEGFEPSFGSGTGFQNWVEFMKRQSFMFPASGLDISGSPYFQKWDDWVKRMGGDKIVNLSHMKSKAKRHLGINSNRYDSFRGYFTDGLQDWSSTYKGNKRDKNVHKALEQ